MAPKAAPPQQPKKETSPRPPIGPGIYDPRAKTRFGTKSPGSATPEPTTVAGESQSIKSGSAGPPYPPSGPAEQHGTSTTLNIRPISPPPETRAPSRAASTISELNLPPRMFPNAGSTRSDVTIEVPVVDEVQELDIEGFEDLDCAALLEINKTNAAIWHGRAPWTIGIPVHQGRNNLPDGRSSLAASIVFFDESGRCGVYCTSDDAASASDALRDLLTKSARCIRKGIYQVTMPWRDSHGV